jgi:methylenetetrahydrofolate dehydrogenase (NADP+)/methenyltetrahydrofolate cyclohydrolase
MSRILSGRPVSAQIQQALKVRVASLPETPALHIIMVGDDPTSMIYTASKKRFGESAGATVSLTQFPADIRANELIQEIERVNSDTSVHGIILQLPVPAHLKSANAQQRIIPTKDVDGLTFANAGRLFSGFPSLVPATARGVMLLLDHYGIAVAGKHIAVIGRSSLVGLPIAHLALRRNATVSILHSQSTDLQKICRQADIIIGAAGHPGLITREFVTSQTIVIDVGISRVAGGLVGDLAPDAASIVKAYTPVPGGVGPMTISGLFLNLLDAYESQLSTADTPPR